MNEIFSTWNWYIAGPLIGLFVPLLLIIGNKMFGISSVFEHICSVSLPKSVSSVLDYSRTKNAWKFYFVIGIALGAYISVNFLSDAPTDFLPEHYYSVSGYIELFIGGILVGFGTRYANGCTSGHAITGFSLLNSGSIKSTISFFIGGLIYTFLAVYIF